MQRRPDFLRLRGLYRQHSGQLDLARRDLKAAMSLAPGARDVETAMLWLLIESRDAAALRHFLATHEPQWRRDPALHDALAAAHLALSRPRFALDNYLTPHLAERQNDFLWLMNYADALEQNQLADRAWRLRRHLLSREWQAVRASGTLPATANDSTRFASKFWLSANAPDRARRLARARLLMSQRSGDSGLAALRELLRLDREAEAAEGSLELALGWLQEAGEYSAERGYLWQQYARSLGKPANRPLWAEISVALATDDVASLRPVVERHGEFLPRYDRINAAARLGDLRLAQSDAFETQETQNDDDPLHIQLAESLLAFSDHAGGEAIGRDLGAIGEQAATAEMHLALTPKLALDFQLGRIERHNVDEAAIRNVPNENFVSLRIDWRHDDSSTRFLIEQRRSLAEYTPLQIEYQHRLDDRVSLRIGLGQHLASPESTALRVAGMKDRLAAGLDYRFTRQDRISFEQLVERYELQTGSPVGRGSHTQLLIAHALRQESRDLEISAFWSAHRFQRESAYSDPALQPLLPAGTAIGDLRPDFFLPENFNFYGIRLASDLRYERQYTRALRPYGSIARTWHSALGAGYDLRLGLAGSLLGADHFSLSWGLGKSGPQTGGLTRELKFNYRLHY